MLKLEGGGEDIVTDIEKKKRRGCNQRKTLDICPLAVGHHSFKTIWMRTGNPILGKFIFMMIPQTRVGTMMTEAKYDKTSIPRHNA